MPTLERYRRSRLIVVEPGSTANEVARQMAAYGDTTAIVYDGRTLVGIVTERDVAREIVASALDPRTTLVCELMSRDVATLDVGAEIAEVAPLMRRRACRRIPITEDGLVVGLVTLDDLLIDGEFGQAIRLVVAAQLDAAAEEQPRRSRRFAGRIAPVGSGTARARGRVAADAAAAQR